MNIRISKNAFIASLIYVVVSIVFIVSLTVRKNAVHRKLKEVVSDTAAHYALVQGRLQFLEAMNKADHAFFLGQYETSLDSFEALMPFANDAEQNALTLRMNRIKDHINSVSSTDADLKLYREQLEVVTAEFKEYRQKQDSIFLSKQNTTTDQSQKITALEKLIAEKDRKLQAKDKLQVISFRNEIGNMVHYLGEVKDAKANGGGIGIWDTGGIYKGSWKNNKRHGEGTYTWKDGHRFEGTFVEDIRTGFGTYYWSTGEKYVGEWKNNQRHGDGTLYDKDNNIQHKGQWEKDKIKA